MLGIDVFKCRYLKENIQILSGYLRHVGCSCMLRCIYIWYLYLFRFVRIFNAFLIEIRNLSQNFLNDAFAFSSNYIEEKNFCQIEIYVSFCREWMGNKWMEADAFSISLLVKSKLKVILHPCVCVVCKTWTGTLGEEIIFSPQLLSHQS